MKNSARTLTALAAAVLIPLGALAADAPPPAASETKATDSKAKKAEPKCEQSSASRIRKNEADCAKDSQPTRSYSKEELDGTGQTDTGEALRRLDPRVQ